jgi:hypothetical protein
MTARLMASDDVPFVYSTWMNKRASHGVRKKMTAKFRGEEGYLAWLRGQSGS